jgi:ketosteroid isomerase-like protein
MSNNAEFIKNLYGAFAKGDVPFVLGSFDPNIEWIEAEGFPTGGTYNSPEEVLNGVFMPLVTDWDGYRVEPEEFLDAGNRIVALGHYSGTYKATGKSMRVPFAHVWTVQNGKIVKFVQYTDTLKVAEVL